MKVITHTSLLIIYNKWHQGFRDMLGTCLYGWKCQYGHMYVSPQLLSRQQGYANDFGDPLTFPLEPLTGLYF